MWSQQGEVEALLREVDGLLGKMEHWGPMVKAGALVTSPRFWGLGPCGVLLSPWWVLLSSCPLAAPRSLL